MVIKTQFIDKLSVYTPINTQTIQTYIHIHSITIKRTNNIIEITILTLPTFSFKTVLIIQ